MIIFLNILISFFFSLSQLYAQDLIKDEDYYNTGVNHYDNGDFKESFIVFFNLSEKGNKDAIYNLSNMYFEGIGTTQNFNKSLKYSWLCALNGNDKCIKKIKKIKDKLSEDEVSNPISWKLMLLIMLMQLLTNIMLVVVLYLK